MKFAKFAAVAVLLVPAVLAGSAALATPTVVVSGGFASAVDNLSVDGTLYDVTFAGPLDLTFNGNPSGALDAANGLAAALNASTAINVTGPFGSANGFTIADDSSGNGPTVGDPPATLGNWSVNIFGPSAPYAQFAAIPAPEPATLAFFAGGLLAARATRRRSRRA